MWAMNRRTFIGTLGGLAALLLPWWRKRAPAPPAPGVTRFERCTFHADPSCVHSTGGGFWKVDNCRVIPAPDPNVPAWSYYDGEFVCDGNDTTLMNGYTAEWFPDGIRYNHVIAGVPHPIAELPASVRIRWPAAS